jgi:hypothetical protein
MAVEINSYLPGLEKQTKRLQKAVMTVIMGKIATKAAELNMTEITKGRNADGSKFKRYTPAYARQKGSSRVDLTETGNMLTSFKILRKKFDKVVVGFPKSQQLKAYYNSFRGGQPLRPFVGLNDRNRQKVHKYAFKLMTGQI